MARGQSALSYTPGQMYGGNTYNTTPTYDVNAASDPYAANTGGSYSQRNQPTINYSSGQLSGGNTYNNTPYAASPSGGPAPTTAPGGSPYPAAAPATNNAAAGPQPYTEEQIRQLEAYRDQQRIWQAQNPGVYKNEWKDPNNPAVQIAKALNPNYGVPTTAQLALPASPFSYGYPTGSPVDAYTATRTWGQMENDRENGTAAGMANAFPNGIPNIGTGLGPRDPAQVANMANMYLQNIANTYGRMGSETPPWVGSRMVDTGQFNPKGQYTGSFGGAPSANTPSANPASLLSGLGGGAASPASGVIGPPTPTGMTPPAGSSVGGQAALQQILQMLQGNAAKAGPEQAAQYAPWINRLMQVLSMFGARGFTG